MNKLNKLVSELCPVGVPRARIDDLIAYEQPTKYLVASKSYDDSYTTPVLTAGQSFLLGYSNEEHGKYPASIESPVIIFDDFTTAYKWVDFEFKVKSSAMKMLTLKPGAPIMLRYFWYALSTIQIDTSEHARYWISKISNLEIPLPPLEIQSEIVRILDIFTELETELEAELEARRTQYEFYRYHLLAKAPAKLLPLSDVCQDFIVPMRDRPKVFDGDVPWCRIEDIEKQYLHGSLSGLKVSQKVIAEMNLKVMPKGTVIASCSASLGRYAITTTPLITNQTFIGLVCGDALYNRYLLHLLPLKTAELTASSNSGTIPYISRVKFERLRIPVPSLGIQHEIAKILDAYLELDAELEGELSNRRQQYEYYRSRLLTFKELEVV